MGIRGPAIRRTALKASSLYPCLSSAGSAVWVRLAWIPFTPYSMNHDLLHEEYVAELPQVLRNLGLVFPILIDVNHAGSLRSLKVNGFTRS